jgi:hypothetical protein
MGATDFKDLKRVPEKVEAVVKMLAKNAVHLAELLKSKPYPGYL